MSKTDELKEMIREFEGSGGGATIERFHSCDGHKDVYFRKRIKGGLLFEDISVGSARTYAEATRIAYRQWKEREGAR